MISISQSHTFPQSTSSDSILHENPYQANIVDSFDVVIPAPSGICSDGQSFWIPNYAAYKGDRMIYQIDIRTHQITSSIPAPYAWSSGMAWDGSYLWVMDAYPLHQYSLIKLSVTGQIMGYFSAEYSCYWSGMAWDGSYLYYGTNICKVPESRVVSMIFKANPSNGAVVDSILPPSGNINGLVFYKGSFWYCDQATKQIYEMTIGGVALRSFASPGSMPSGLAITQGYLWNVDFHTKRIYQIAIGLAPAIPSGLVAEGGDKTVQLSWTSNADADLYNYKVYRSLSGDFLTALCIDSVDPWEVSYEDHSVINRQTYYYWLTAIDSDGYESHISQSVSVIPLDKIPPAPPQQVSSQAGYGKVTLTWITSDAKDLSYYRIYRGISDSLSNANIIDSVWKPATVYIDSVFNTPSMLYYWVTAVDSAGNESTVLNGVTSKPILPTAFVLQQNYPNPFNSSTIIRYELPTQAVTMLKIYNTIGQLIKTFERGDETIGYKQIIWDGTNNLGLTVNSGVYFFVLQIGSLNISRKGIYLR